MPLVVNVYGGTANMETDFGTTPEGATAHLPLNKIVWGDDSVSYKVNETYPLPVQVMAVTGEALVVSGNLGASGSFPVINPTTGVTGIQFLAVGGSTSGDPVEVTGSVNISNTLSVGNTLATRYLNSATDSIQVTGGVNILGALDLNSGTDSVSVYGWDGGRYVNTTLFAADGTTIGNSGDALNVNLVNAGVTFSLSVAATIGVTNPNSGANPEDALMIQGISGANPIAVKGRNGEAIEVVNSPGSAVGVTGTFFSDGTQLTKVSEITRSSTIISGFTLASVAGNPIVASSTPLKTGITIKSHPSNTDFIYVGNTGLTGGITTNGYPLESGESIFLECSNANLIHISGISGDSRMVHYIGS